MDFCYFHDIVLILRCITTLINMELEEVWVEFGGEHKPKITRHSLHARFGTAFWWKFMFFSGNDDVSKVGTKHAVLTCDPLSLTTFAETDSLTTVDISAVERYIVKVWDGACANNIADIFDKLRHDCYLNGKVLTDLPPTSSVTLGGASVWSEMLSLY